jgi:hypothetical protein
MHPSTIRWVNRIAGEVPAMMDGISNGRSEMSFSV